MPNLASTGRILLTGAAIVLGHALTAWSEPIFKSVDSEGRTSYAYTPIANAVSVESIRLNEAPSPDTVEESQEQRESMREATDRMAADRKYREEERQKQAAERRSRETYYQYEYESEPTVQYYYPYYPRYRRAGGFTQHKSYAGHKNFHKKSHRKFHKRSPLRSSFRSRHFHHRSTAMGPKRSIGHLKTRTHRRSGVRARIRLE